MRNYRRMTWTDRLIIEKMFNQGQSCSAIAQRLGFAVSSVCREIKRGLYDHTLSSLETVKRYSAQIAQDVSDWNSTAKGCPIKLGSHHDFAALVAERIQNGESPDQVTGDLKRKGCWTVCTSTLYDYIDKGYIPGVTNKNLLEKSKPKKRSYRQVRAARPPKGESIERRPDEIESRSTFGHWEMDLVVGKAEGPGEALMVLTERLTRFEVIHKLADKMSKTITEALWDVCDLLPDGSIQSLTCDNGPEFMDYDGMREIAPVYYCHPFCSWEKGSCENANKLVRRFFPKGQSMKNRTQDDCDAASRSINSMHRKSLGYRTSAELFDYHVSML